MKNTKQIIIWLVVSIVAMLLLTVGIIAADFSFDQLNPSYPGMDQQNGRACNIGLALVKEGVAGYYKVYGQWPQSWRDVVDSGIVQVQLLGVDGEYIDPDDTRLDFESDVIYYLDSGTPGVTTLMAGQRIDSVLQAPRTYQEQGQQAAAASGDQAYADLVADQDACRLFALLGICHHMLMIYTDLHGTPPRTWDDFLNSGLAPIDASSRNPVTGGSLATTGGAWGIDYYYGDKQAFGLIHLDACGEHPQYLMSY